MKMHILATRDILADVFGQPFTVPNLGQAIRSFGDQCRLREKGNILGEHPEDFELMHLGDYEDAKATFEIFDTPRQIAAGANYRAQ